MRILKRRCGVSRQGLTRTTKGKNVSGGALKAAMAMDMGMPMDENPTSVGGNLDRLRDSLSKLSLRTKQGTTSKTRPRYISI